MIAPAVTLNDSGASGLPAGLLPEGAGQFSQLSDGSVSSNAGTLPGGTQQQRQQPLS